MSSSARADAEKKNSLSVSKSGSKSAQNSGRKTVKRETNASPSQVATTRTGLETINEEGGTEGKKKDKDDDKAPRLTWSNQTEELLISWADIALCYKWLHDESFRKYSKLNYNFSIPIIILSTLTGTLNFGLQSFMPTEYVNYAQAGIGAVNIFTGIITTLQNFFRYAQLSESHFNASAGWSKLHRNISIELKIEKEYRKEANTFVKVCRIEYDRLLENNPIIPIDVIALFTKKLKEQAKEHSENIVLPDICGNISHTTVYRVVQEEKLLPEIKDAFIDAANSADGTPLSSRFRSVVSSRKLAHDRIQKANEAYRPESYIEDDDEDNFTKPEFVPSIDLNKINKDEIELESIVVDTIKPQPSKPTFFRARSDSYHSVIMNPDAKAELPLEPVDVKLPIPIKKSFGNVNDIIKRFGGSIGGRPVIAKQDEAEIHSVSQSVRPSLSIHSNPLQSHSARPSISQHSISRQQSDLKIVIEPAVEAVVEPTIESSPQPAVDSHSARPSISQRSVSRQQSDLKTVIEPAAEAVVEPSPQPAVEQPVVEPKEEEKKEVEIFDI